MSVLWQDDSTPAADDLAAIFPRNRPSASAKPTLDGNLRRGPKVKAREFGPTLPLGLIARTTRPVAVTYEKPSMAARAKRWLHYRGPRMFSSRFMDRGSLAAILFMAAVILYSVIRAMEGR